MCAELDEALDKATKAKTGVYFEVVTDPCAASPLARKLRDSLQTLCGS
jgi:indolepyruvate decarboxylase